MLDISKLTPEKFEKVCYQLAYHEFSNLGFLTDIDGSGGDGGVEFYLTLENGDVRGRQSKFFTHRVGQPQRKQIEESLKRSRLHHPNLKKWILCLPIKLTVDVIKGEKLTKGERSWFNEFIQRNNDIEIIERFLSDIDTLLIKYPKINDSFFAEDPVKRKEALISLIDSKKDEKNQLTMINNKLIDVDGIFQNGTEEDLNWAKTKYTQYNVAKFRFVDCRPIMEDITNIEKDINVENLDSYEYKDFKKDFQSTVKNYFVSYRPKLSEQRPAFDYVLHDIGKQIGGVLSVGVSGSFVITNMEDFYKLEITKDE